MVDTSGFFTSIEELNGTSECGLELIHQSEEGYSAIYLGCTNGKKFAYKTLKPEYRGVPLYEDLLRKEFEIGCRLDHPNICQYFRLVAHSKLGNAIEMEWINGICLKDAGSFDGKTAVRLAMELCEAVGYLHSKQIIHRDIKPTNIMVTANGCNLKLIDFGFSDSEAHTLLKCPAGTFDFAAPELIAGTDSDYRCDIYSIGKILRFLTPWKKRLIRRCLETNKENRPKSAFQIKKSLAEKTFVTVAYIVAALVLAGISIFVFCRKGSDGVNESEAVPYELQQVQTTDSVSIEDLIDEATRMMLDADGDN